MLTSSSEYNNDVAPEMSTMVGWPVGPPRQSRLIYLPKTFGWIRTAIQYETDTHLGIEDELFGVVLVVRWYFICHHQPLKTRFCPLSYWPNTTESGSAQKFLPVKGQVFLTSVAQLPACGGILGVSWGEFCCELMMLENISTLIKGSENG